MQSKSFFEGTNHVFGSNVREVRLPQSSNRAHEGHSIRIVNEASSVLLIKSATKNWKLLGNATSAFTYSGGKWSKQESGKPEKVACPDKTDGSCSSSESSDEDDCKRGQRGPPGRDGCPGANGLNGLNGKNGRCECKNTATTLVTYQGAGLTYNVPLQAPCWAKVALITAVGGGGAGGLAGTGAEVLAAGSGGGSGYAITQSVPVSGGFLALSIGAGGLGLTGTDGNPTTVTYTGTLPYVVYAPGGQAGSSLVADFPPASNGQYGGGAADGFPTPTPAGQGFEDGDPAIPGVSGGAGGGYLPGAGGLSSATSVGTIYGAGGGGSAPGPIAGVGGNGGGSVPSVPATQLNGQAGTYGGGGGGAGLSSPLGAPVVLGLAGNGGNGYVSVTYIC